MYLPWGLCIVLAIAVAALSAKLHFDKKGISEILNELSHILETDTNALISLSSGGKSVKKLAHTLNIRLKDLRKQRLKYQNGDREVKDAVTNISHDLRTPLTAIIGYIELMKHGELPKGVERYLGLIENRAQALRQLTDELFGYSVITHLRREK